MNRKVLSIILFGVLIVSALLWVSASQASQPQSSDTPEIALGEPGLSYRYVDTFGVTEVPYISDTTHINRPMGLFIDANDNIYVAEDPGYRVMKYDSTGSNLLALGKAGVCYTDDYVFCAPNDIVADSSGNFWVAAGNRVVEYNTNGLFTQQFPENEPWNSGNDNTRFNNVMGVALDSSNHLFVSDSYNHRIQVFDISGGSPVYSTTIGVTEAPDSQVGYFNEPQRIAVDNNDRVLVVDHNNDRVQRCAYNSGWVCEEYETGLNNPYGITVDKDDNVYIADLDNFRILKCTGPGLCTDYITGTYGLWDLDVDSEGYVYGAAAYESIVVKFDGEESYPGPYLGVEFVPYLTDGYHYNHPKVTIDPSNNIIILETSGHRLVKLDPQGNFLWSYGVPGVDNPYDNQYLNWPQGVATDTSGNIYVMDGNCRVRILNPNGVYLHTLGTGCGSGDYQFGNWGTNIAVGDNGYIYVADSDNHRIQIYNSNRVFIGRIGYTGFCQSDNEHLCNPEGVDVDIDGNVYVADSGNARIQKFNSSWQWVKTIGTNGGWGNEFGQFSWVGDIVVDNKGKIFASDWWNNRVQIFNTDGAFLTSIGGAWGKNTGQFRSVSSVDVDSYGNVYISDWQNARIQKFAEGVPDWKQVNINGFGERWNEGSAALEMFGGYLYAGTSSWEGGRIWRSPDGTNWAPASIYGLGTGFEEQNTAILDLSEFNGYLYASTGWSGYPAQIWRSPDGLTWSQVVGDGFGDANISGINVFVEFNNQLYVAASNENNGVEIWRSSTGDPGSWSQVNSNGFGSGADNSAVFGLIDFNNYLYAGVVNRNVGTQIWRTQNGTQWDQVNTSGFGKNDNYETGGFAEFNGNLYVGTRNDTSGGELWRSSNGTTWELVKGAGFGDSNNIKVESLIVHDTNLIAALNNSETGLEIWLSKDGTNWDQINLDGFGDSNNDWTKWNNSTVIFNGSYIVSVGNSANGTELWRYDPQENIYLPVVLR